MQMSIFSQWECISLERRELNAIYSSVEISSLCGLN